MVNSEEIKDKAIALGFHVVGIGAIDRSRINQANERLNQWLDRGYHGQMDWMNNPKRQNIRLIMPDVKSVISVGINYYNSAPRPTGKEYGKISRYAWGRDYHRVLTGKLKQLSTWLQAQDGGIQVRYYVDTGPISDKFWAEQSGIGWIAKNGNLINRNYGSWLFLGEILTNLELESDRPHLPHCGNCTRCITACPTQAITEPFVVDADRCIAYHTIENRCDTLPPAIAHNLDNWVAGCDICQDVCPWNQRFAQPTDISDFTPKPDLIAPKLTDLAQMTEEEWDIKFTGSALRRIKPFMWHRNAQAVIDQNHM